MARSEPLVSPLSDDSRPCGATAASALTAHSALPPGPCSLLPRDSLQSGFSSARVSRLVRELHRRAVRLLSLLLTIKNSGFSPLNESRARTRPTPVTRNNASRVRNAQQVLRDLCRTEEHDSEQRVAGPASQPGGVRARAGDATSRTAAPGFLRAHGLAVRPAGPAPARAAQPRAPGACAVSLIWSISTLWCCIWA